MLTAREQSIHNIAVASQPRTGFPIFELIPIISAVIGVLSKCQNTAETPEQFVAAHQESDGTFSQHGIVRVRRQVRMEAWKQGVEMNAAEANVVAKQMLAEGATHGANLGAVMSEGE